MADGKACRVVDLAHERLIRQVDEALSLAELPLGPPPGLDGAEAVARLRLLAETIDAMDWGDKRATDVVRLARQLTSEVCRG